MPINLLQNPDNLSNHLPHHLPNHLPNHPSDRSYIDSPKDFDKTLEWATLSNQRKSRSKSNHLIKILICVFIIIFLIIIIWIIADSVMKDKSTIDKLSDSTHSNSFMSTETIYIDADTNTPIPLHEINAGNYQIID